MKEVTPLSDLEARLVRYVDLRPCRNAFIDTRNPGSEEKENFTIIGPGVAENPEQYVHISLPHGFNVGAARQPPGCVNSQHSHESAEVFIIHSGHWRFVTGEDGRDGFVDLEPGDVISVPTNVFRGFENIGTDMGFMFAVLGGDDPGRVTWAPYVFEEAKRHGLVLLRSGQLIDTAQARVPENAELMPITSKEAASRLRQVSSSEVAECVVRRRDFAAGGGLSVIRGFAECPIIGVANPVERTPAGRMGWQHGFQVRALNVEPGAKSPPHSREEEEVVLMHSGTLKLNFPAGCIELCPGDCFSVPKGMIRSYENDSSQEALAYVVRGGDHPSDARWAGQAPNDSGSREAIGR